MHTTVRLYILSRSTVGEAPKFFYTSARGTSPRPSTRQQAGERDRALENTRGCGGEKEAFFQASKISRQGSTEKETVLENARGWRGEKEVILQK